MDLLACAPVLTTSEELMEIQDIVSARLQIPQGTPQAASSDIWVASGKSQSYIRILCHLPGTVPNSSLVIQSYPVKAGSIDTCISPPQLITIQESDSDEKIVMARVSSVDQMSIL
jgi:hypothetical protein